MAFILLVAFSALFVAGCAAFFSIKGLIVLFSGSSLAIGIMASSLEIGKLVAASFLHTYWKKISFLLRLYLCAAVFVLMCITSLGIFGFLTGAYQVHSAKVNTFDTRIATLVNEKSAIDQAILEQTSRIKVLTDIRTTQEQRVQTAGNYKAPRDQAYKAISDANEEIQKKENDIAQSRQRGIEIDREISDLKITLNTTTDVGSFKFIADALHTNVDTSVQYFIFALIAVFDPLAVALVLAWNKLVEQRATKRQEDHEDYLRAIISNNVAPDGIIIMPSKEEEEEEPQEPSNPGTELTPADSSAHTTEAEQDKSPLEESSTTEQPAIEKHAMEPMEESMYAADLENDPNFQKLSEEQKAEIRNKRMRYTGSNNSVIRIN